MESSARIRRPRNVNVFQAAALLYGDWGTSKAYVIGLAFAFAGYHSFWLVALVALLMLLVGLNYISICKFSPNGGGVYASARKHSQVLALVGAFFLLADYLVTAALSALSCFEYLGVHQPLYWTMGAIVLIGVLNYLGPRHSGNLALAVAAATVGVVVLLAISALPFIHQAIDRVQPLEGGFLKNWDSFVSIIVALSGIESIANATGVLQLDPGSSLDKPSVHQTSKKAILWVMAEVCFFTAFFALALNAIEGLRIEGTDVFNAEGEAVRDSMLRYMGEYFASHLFGNEALGLLFGSIVSITFAVLLLSAVNTAIVSLVSLLFVMSKDGEMPRSFQKLSPFGVPIYPLLFTVLAILSILVAIHDVVGLANLYAVGFVGAIATNLAVNGWDRTLPMSKKERGWMLATSFFLFLIEVTLLITKPEARNFAFSIMGVGLILRMWIAERRQKELEHQRRKPKHASLYEEENNEPIHEGAILCPVRSIGKTLSFAIEEAKKMEQPLYIFFIREQRVITEGDIQKTWLDDEEACDMFDYIKDLAPHLSLKFFYQITAQPAKAIVNMAEQLRVSRVILGRPRENLILQLIRGNIEREIAKILPASMDLIVIS